MTYNIRYAGDPEKEGVNSWENRKEHVAYQIKKNNADIIGLQEPLLGQLNDLVKLLPGYIWIGKGRDDGDIKGEFSAILFRKDKFDLLNHKTIWLSTSPETPSRGWDAALNRTATYAEFKIKESGITFYFFNTHFDHIGREAREHSAELMTGMIKDIAGENPVILTGDFNDTAFSKPYEIITTYLKDSRTIAFSISGPEFTFNGFDNDIEEGEKIDYIFITGKLDVTENQVILDKFEGLYPSDHFPVFALIKFRK